MPAFTWFDMNSNIEIKARARDFARLRQLAQQLTDTPEQVLEQDDTFFCVPHGRLKLRTFSPIHGELIYYQRDNLAGPKRSHYCISPTPDPLGLKATLAAALGIQGSLRKKRLLYLVGQTRIHLDQVETLGKFVELEVVMTPNQTSASATQTAHDLMKTLEIHPDDLIDRAYIDLLNDESSKSSRCY